MRVLETEAEHERPPGCCWLTQTGGGGWGWGGVTGEKSPGQEEHQPKKLFHPEQKPKKEERGAGSSPKRRQ